MTVSFKGFKRLVMSTRIFGHRAPALSSQNTIDSYKSSKIVLEGSTKETIEFLILLY